MCRTLYHARSLRQECCSKQCRWTFENERRRAGRSAYQPRSNTYTQGGPRPLLGPGAHPYLVAFRHVRAAIAAAAPDQAAAVEARELARLRAEHGATDPKTGEQFAAMIAWVLTANARPLCACGCGDYARPDNQYIQGHGTRAPGWAKVARA